MEKKVSIYDSTLRDGAQGEGISFSAEDKLKIVKTLDALGVDYIEAGNPASNPKDLEFFKRVRNVELRSAKLVAFGSTRRKFMKPEEDENLMSLLGAGTAYMAIFGKCWDFHVTDVINTTLEENLLMIGDTVRYLTEKGKKVFFDGEHFFDGYKNNPEYAMAALAAAKEAGAISLVLCDTNGGCLTGEAAEITRKVKETFGMTVGVHFHNDSGLAVANSVESVLMGATEVQGTFIGFGERCGNTNLSTVIPNLQLKLGYTCVPQDRMELLTDTARFVSEVANISFDENAPYVGRNAFTHKGGMHIDGMNKDKRSFEHLEPTLVGNARRFLMSEVSGRSTVLKNIQKIVPGIGKDSEEAFMILKRLKELEHEGYQFEGAESTFELVIRKQLGKYHPFFDLEDFKIIGEKPDNEGLFSSYAMVKINVEGKTKITAAEGEGPVNALDKALRECLEGFYPVLKKTYLTDYKVRVLDGKDATAAKVRVLITTTDGHTEWTTIGVSTDIIRASLIALTDSIEIKLLRELEVKIRNYI